MNFLYKTEVIELLPLGKTNCYDQDINCSKTKMRRTTGFAYEYWDGKSDLWFAISDSRYIAILNRHKNGSIVRRGITEEVIDPEWVFDVSDHFIERVLERHVHNEESVNSFLSYMITNGYYIKDNFNRKNKDGRFYIYEPDMRAICVVVETDDKFVLVTTYEPSKDKWFAPYLNPDNLRKRYPKFKAYLKEHFELQELVLS